MTKASPQRGPSSVSWPRPPRPPLRCGQRPRWRVAGLRSRPVGRAAVGSRRERTDSPAPARPACAEAQGRVSVPHPRGGHAAATTTSGSEGWAPASRNVCGRLQGRDLPSAVSSGAPGGPRMAGGTETRSWVPAGGRLLGGHRDSACRCGRGEPQCSGGPPGWRGDCWTRLPGIVWGIRHQASGGGAVSSG